MDSARKNRVLKAFGEDAGLIRKENDKYAAAGKAQGVLVGLIAAIAGTKIARNEYANQ